MVDMLESATSCEVPNDERIQAFHTWQTATNTKLTQINGQRRYGGPPEGWEGPVPGDLCEVFINQIPRDVYEDLLIPLFSSVGPLWEFRLMMNFSGQNRGFAYAKYGSTCVAAQAIYKLDGHSLVPGCNIRVRYSYDKRTLRIGKLPVTMKYDELLKELQMIVEGVERVSMKTGPNKNGHWALLVFISHRAASMAKKMLAEAFQKRFALNVLVRWQTDVIPSHNTTRSAPRQQHIASIPASPCLNRACRPRRLTTAVEPTDEALHSTYSTFAPKAHAESQAVMVMRMQKQNELLNATLSYLMPLCDVNFSHAEVNGFLHFNYKVHIPTATEPFTGMVVVLPGPTAQSVPQKAQQAAAQQVLQKMFCGLLRQ